MEWSEFIQYIIDSVTNETVSPKIDVLSGLYVSIEEQLKTRESTKFRILRRSRDENLFDKIHNHTKRIIHPILCPHSKGDCIVHAEEKQGII